MKEFQYQFSIVMPVYNAEKYIKEAIESVIHQTFDFHKVQVLLINDGSKDGSKKICEQYSNQYGNIEYFEQENQGVSVARNLGIKNSKGKYILFLDADDMLKKNVLSNVSSFFDQHYDEVDLVAYALKYKHGNYIRLRNHIRYKTEYKKGTGIYDIKEYPNCIQTTINYVIKNEFEQTQLFDDKLRFAEDENFATRMIMKKERYGYCSDCLYVYRRNDTSLTKTYAIQQHTFDLFVKYYQFIFSTYKNYPYIQLLLLNSLRWRLVEDKLWPNVEEKYQENVETVKELLKHIDVDTILNYKDMNIFHKMYLCKLKKCETSSKLEDGEFQFYVNNKMVYKHKDVDCYLQDIQYHNNVLTCKGELLSPCFEAYTPSLKCICNGSEKKLELDHNVFVMDISYSLGKEVELIVEYGEHTYYVNPWFNMKFDSFVSDGNLICSKKKNAFIVDKTNKWLTTYYQLVQTTMKYSQKIFKK